MILNTSNSLYFFFFFSFLFCFFLFYSLLFSLSFSSLSAPNSILLNFSLSNYICAFITNTMGKSRKPQKPYTDDEESVGSQRDNGSGSNNGGTFIDHRQYNDLVHIHSSPARTRRRNSQLTTPYRNDRMFERNNGDRTPLTNNNLRQFNDSGSVSPGDGRYGNHQGFALNMDQYARDQTRFAYSGDDGNMPDYDDDNEFDNQSLNSLEFGGSNPSSEHSSDSTSLDDVCFPDYYGEGENSQEAHWPDLKVMQEFIDLEAKYPEDEVAEEAPDSPTVNFGQPIAKSVANKQIDEAASLNSHTSLKVTPTPIQPWDKTSGVNITPTAPILSKKQTKEDVCRFTYFRHDLNRTIHAPTLGGLLANNGINTTKEQATNLTKKWRDTSSSPDHFPPGNDENKDNIDNKDNNKDSNKDVLTLSDLFQPSHYSKNPSSSSIPSLKTPGPSSGIVTPLAHHSSQNLDAAKNLILKSGVDKSGLDLSQTPQTGTITDSLDRDNTPQGVTPFWLDILNPTEEEMKVLSKTFGIHPLTTEDIFLGEAREKVELFKSYYFICFTSFDVVYERRKQRLKEYERKANKLQEMNETFQDNKTVLRRIFEKLHKNNDSEHYNWPSKDSRSRKSSSLMSNNKKIREGELLPLNMYIIVFKEAVITFHFSATPHPINVRRRARLLKDYLTVTSDWVSYALIDDITDSFAPMIESIEEEVNSIEEAILKMHAGEGDSSDNESDYDEEEEEEEDYSHSSRNHHHNHHHNHNHNHNHDDQNKSHRHRSSSGNDNRKNIFFKRQRSKSTVDGNGYQLLRNRSSKVSSATSASKSSSSKILGWKRKGDMLRRIGECRKRVMSLLRLLGSKADVIKGFSKRLNEPEINSIKKIGIEPKLEISMYLGDIQDHIVTMVQSLNHYEKLLARFHSNYLAQINIDMTKVNNDTNDVLGKITILGTIVLPINVVTGLWGMNCLVPGQEYDGLAWFWSIIFGMVVFSIFAYNYAKRAYGL